MDNCYANWPLVLEYLKVLLSWPPIVLILVIALMPKFVEPVATKIRALIKAKAAGTEWEFAQESQKVEPPPVAGQLGMPQGDEPGQPDQEQGSNASAVDPIPNQAPNEDPLAEIVTNPEKARAEILKWWTVAASEQTFSVVYGTQIAMLHHLRLKASQGIGEAEDNLLQFYSAHKERAAEAALPAAATWNDYLGFMTQVGLVRRDIIEGVPTVRIQPFGAAFLGYIVQAKGPRAYDRIL